MKGIYSAHCHIDFWTRSQKLFSCDATEIYWHYGMRSSLSIM